MGKESQSKKGKGRSSKKRKDRPPLSKHGELTLEDVEWLAEHSYLPESVIETLTAVVTEREETRSGK